MLPKIDYNKISKAISYYENIGYDYIELPWFASEKSMDVTCPPERRLFETFAGFLLASGEQGFIEMRKNLPKGKFMCATPCFRDEPFLDEYHLTSFFKVELINTHTKSQEDLSSMISDSLFFFSRYIKQKDILEVVNTEQGKDINLNGIELGSYGFRSYDEFDWIYGTGLAEPRLSKILQNKG